MHPKLSIVIRNWNHGCFLCDAIDSPDPARTEVTLVDDDSTDDSRHILADYGDRVRAVLKENGGEGNGQ